MGNTPSVEVPRKGSRGTQKLSKPRIGKPLTAGLLKSKDIPNIIRRPSVVGRCLSLPHSPTPISSHHPETESAAGDDRAAFHGTSTPAEEPRLRSLSWPNPQGSLHQGGQTVGVVPSSLGGRRMSATGTAYMGTDEAYEQDQPALTALPRNLSQSLLNYDRSSYEAKRLLNLAEEPAFEDQSIASESQFQAPLSRRQSCTAPLSRRQSYTAPYHPHPADGSALLFRTNSDVSLYTPMRKRSLMTPGVATRPTPADSIALPDMPTTDALPPSLLHFDPPEPLGASLLPIPHTSFGPHSVPRAHTPSEADYQQTGAFKHGTLRIMNGSPARTPAQEPADINLSASSSPAMRGRVRRGKITGSGSPALPCLTTVSSTTSTSNSVIVMAGLEAATNFLPELKLSMSPFAFSGIEPESPGLQITSKNTAIEDELFEDGTPEYGSEVLNIRLDLDAKPPSSSGPVKEGKQKEMNRSDSGVATTPTSTTSYKPLSKADSGYSSTVSMRSLSSKCNRPQEVDLSRDREAISPRATTFEPTKLPQRVPMWERSDTVGPAEVQSKIPSVHEPPPPVPEKDYPLKIPKPAASKLNDSQVPTKRPSLVSEMGFTDSTLGSANDPNLNLDDSSMPISTLSISNARKPGRLQRLLNGARAPLTVHVTHALDREAHVPPVPHSTQERLHEHTTSSPISYDGSAEAASDNAKATAVNEGPISQVFEEGVEMSQNNSPSARKNRNKNRGFRSNFDIHSIGSSITRAASSVMAKHSILKSALAKPIPADEGLPYQVFETPATPKQQPNKTSQWHHEEVERINAASLLTGDWKERYGPHAEIASRPSSMSASVGGPASTIYGDARHSSLASHSKQYATAFQKQSLPGQYFISRTPPPVSMKTRNMGPLRVPPPIRPRSTPPTRSGAPLLSHKPSREGVQSYPPYFNPMNPNHATLSRQSSQGRFYAYSAAQIQAFLNQPAETPGVSPFNPSNIQPRQGEYWIPGSNSNSRHSMTAFRGHSFDHGRRNSLTSQSSQHSAPSNRPPWPQYVHYGGPALEHRSSYDGYSLQARHNYGQDNGPYPLLPHTNGQAYLSDPSTGQPALSQFSQYQQHTRFVPRGHFRHHSLDQYGSSAPYRVLHSYNSPAYRGVPIWSN